MRMIATTILYRWTALHQLILSYVRSSGEYLSIFNENADFLAKPVTNNMLTLLSQTVWRECEHLHHSALLLSQTNFVLSSYE